MEGISQREMCGDEGRRTTDASGDLEHLVRQYQRCS
jgi:hypothetical protein